MPRRHHAVRTLAPIALLCACVAAFTPAVTATASPPAAVAGAPMGASVTSATAAHADSPRGVSAESAAWVWPVSGPREVVAPFRAPAYAYGAGHRGMDIAAVPEQTVVAPADGVIAFRGTVVDRALLTIEHAGGLVSTFEPVVSTLSPGDAVVAGQEIGTLSLGGHTEAGALHLGVRLDGEYINPMLLFGGVPRAILLPCCE